MLFEHPHEAPDGARSTLLVADVPGSRSVRVIAPAMGVAAGYYTPLVESLAARGLSVVVHEHRCVGSSDQRPGRKVDFGYHHAVSVDLAHTLQWTRGRFPEAEIVLVGHSLGAQLSSLLVATRSAAPDTHSGLGPSVSHGAF